MGKRLSGNTIALTSLIFVICCFAFFVYLQTRPSELEIKLQEVEAKIEAVNKHIIKITVSEHVAVNNAFTGTGKTELYLSPITLNKLFNYIDYLKELEKERDALKKQLNEQL